MVVVLRVDKEKGEAIYAVDLRKAWLLNGHSIRIYRPFQTTSVS